MTHRSEYCDEQRDRISWMNRRAGSHMMGNSEDALPITEFSREDHATPQANQG